MYREVSGAFRATFLNSSRMKSPVVVLVKTFVYYCVTLRRYSRRFHSRSYFRCHSQVPSLSLSHPFNLLFSDFNLVKTSVRIEWRTNMFVNSVSLNIYFFNVIFKCTYFILFVAYRIFHERIIRFLAHCLFVDCCFVMTCDLWLASRYYSARFLLFVTFWIK